MLAVTLLCLLVIVLTSTGVMLASRMLMGRDLLVIVVILALYGIFAMLYEMYGPITNLFVAIIYMVCLVYVCIRVARFISQTEVVIWDLQHSARRTATTLQIPSRKVQIMFWFRLYSLLLLSVLLIGNIISVFLFDSYPYIPVIFDQSIIYFYFILLVYLFRSTAINRNLYDEVCPILI